MTGEETGDKGTLADFLTFLWRHKVLIAGIVGISTLITVIYVLVVPVEYTAKATVLPPEDSGPSLMNAVMSLVGANLGGLNLSGQAREASIQEALVRSRRMADVIEGDLSLGERYGIEKREARLRAWFSRLGTKASQQGLLTISYQDRDPEFATEVVSHVLKHLNEFNLDYRVTGSRQVRIFLEERLADAEARLLNLEDSLAAYQSENLTLAISPSVEGVIAAGAEILTDRMRLSTEAQLLRRTLGPDAPALAAKEMEIEALDSELARLPRINSELARLLRSRRVHERTFSFLSAQLEETRIEEARDTPTVDLLDPPVVPEEKSWPQRTYSVLIVFLVSGVLSLLVGKLVDSIREAHLKIGRQGV